MSKFIICLNLVMCPKPREKAPANFGIPLRIALLGRTIINNFYVHSPSFAPKSYILELEKKANLLLNAAMDMLIVFCKPLKKTHTIMKNASQAFFSLNIHCCRRKISIIWLISSDGIPITCRTEVANWIVGSTVSGITRLAPEPRSFS